MINRVGAVNMCTRNPLEKISTAKQFGRSSVNSDFKIRRREPERNYFEAYAHACVGRFPECFSRFYVANRTSKLQFSRFERTYIKHGKHLVFNFLNLCNARLL